MVKEDPAELREELLSDLRKEIFSQPIIVVEDEPDMTLRSSVRKLCGDAKVPFEIISSD